VWAMSPSLNVNQPTTPLRRVLNRVVNVRKDFVATGLPDLRMTPVLWVLLCTTAESPATGIVAYNHRPNRRAYRVLPGSVVIAL
jgi:hypothetical protein